MTKYGCLLIFLALIGMVMTRVIIMKKHGMKAFVFAKTHRNDYVLLPFVLFYIYHLFANVFDLVRLNQKRLMYSSTAEWIGLFICIMGLCLFVWGLYSLKESFRVGIDDQSPGALITTGAFGISRHPLYVAVALELIGFFLIFPYILFLVYLFAGVFVLRRQMIREEEFLKRYYGKEYETYCLQVRRYLCGYSYKKTHII